jgi:antitoxin ParD1/3/4
MAKNSYLLLGDYFENFVSEKVASGKYAVVSELFHNALRLFEQEENKTKSLIDTLKIGEKSGFVEDFDVLEDLKKLHAKHWPHGI